MFNIPDFNKMEMTFVEAEGILKIDGSILRGMEHINEHWERYCAGEAGDRYETDEEFFDVWSHEANAYNIVYTTMKPLFV
jgi:hypothetical protein